MICLTCNQSFNPALLSEVFAHEHRGIETDKEYFGTQVNVEKCRLCSGSGNYIDMETVNGESYVVTRECNCAQREGK